AEHAIEPALAAQFRLLRAPERRRGQVFIDGRLEFDIGRLERACRPHELLVEAPERGAAVAGHEACRIETRATIAFLLHQAKANESLIAGCKNPALPHIEFVVERDVGERHFWKPLLE